MSDGGELQCGSCSKQLTYAAGETVVTCPHCGTLLAIPDTSGPESTIARPAGIPEVGEAGNAFPGLPSDHAAAGESAINAFSVGEQLKPNEPAPTPEHTAAEPIQTPEPAAAESPSTVAKDFLNWAAGNESHAAEPVEMPDIATGKQAHNHDLGEIPSFEDETLNETNQDTLRNYVAPAAVKSDSDDNGTASSSPRPSGRKPSATPSGVPRHLFLLLAGYASAVTLALIWMFVFGGPTHPLESLPDVEPKKNAEGKTAYPFPEDDAAMPRGHTLKFGETRRYGNLEITPLRVTHGPLQLAGSDVLEEIDFDNRVFKLWLKIRNVSSDQTIMPFGRDIVLLKSQEKRVNTFVARNDARTKTRVPLWSYQMDSPTFLLKDQQIDRKLAPGESYETYLASDNYGIDALTGELVWRVHFRKGYNPKSKRGVTTLIEILFNRDDVRKETAGS